MRVTVEVPNSACAEMTLMVLLKMVVVDSTGEDMLW